MLHYYYQKQSNEIQLLSGGGSESSKNPFIKRPEKVQHLVAPVFCAPDSTIPNMSVIPFTNHFSNSTSPAVLIYRIYIPRSALIENLASKKEPLKNLSHHHETIYMGGEIY